jgi:hypothetical protein
MGMSEDKLGFWFDALNLPRAEEAARKKKG